jgi:hypothetical protein
MEDTYPGRTPRGLRVSLKFPGHEVAAPE